MPKRKPSKRKKPGPTEARLTISGKWKDAIKKALKKKPAR